MQFKPAENPLSCSYQVIKAVANVLPRNFIIPEATQLHGGGKLVRDEKRKKTDGFFLLQVVWKWYL